jgi:hypothetical protein
MQRFTFKTVRKLLDHVFSLDYFLPEGKKPPPISYHRVHGKGRLVVMVGENASGKSFARRCVQAVAARNKIEPIAVSMEGRTTGGIMTAFVYGAEAWQSTGEISAGTVIGGISTCRGRNKDHIIFWDEPDLGLSDSWAAGVGRSIRRFARRPPKHTLAICVVTHSKALVSQLLDVDPHFVYFGDDADEPPQSLTHWLERPVVPRDIEELKKLSHARFLRIQKILDAVEKRKRE